MFNPFNIFKPFMLLRMVNGVFFLTGLFAAAVFLHASMAVETKQSIDTIITGSVDKIDRLIQKSK